MINIVLADNHELVRKSLAVQLAADPTLNVVAEARDATEAISLTRKYHPAVLVLDLTLGNSSGFDVMRELGREQATRILVVSVCDDETHAVESLRLGSFGYLPKTSPAAEFLQAIHEVADGRVYVAQTMRPEVMETLMQQMKRPNKSAAALTERERAVLRMGAEGRSNVHIARELGISRRTIESHRANLMKKLNLKTQTELVRYAIRNGIISA